MLKSSFKNASKFTNIGVICPVYVDDTSDNYYSKYSQDDALISVQTVASSGSYIEREIWRDVGAFDDKLFIDGIDHEWCFRLQSRGYRCFVDRRIQMKHRMGEYSITFFGTAKPVHRDPIRHYFIIRNTLYLTSKAYIPNSWKFLELLKSIRRIVFYILASRNRSLTIKYMFQAVFDAAKQKMGPLK